MSGRTAPPLSGLPRPLGLREAAVGSGVVRPVLAQGGSEVVLGAHRTLVPRWTRRAVRRAAVDAA